MLKLLIVEDERWEREGLLDFIDWNALGIAVPVPACDGFEGIELAQRIRPDIIITDIKMPGMDGLKMSGKIREFLPEVKIIVLTGYDDFRLAQEAIRINTFAYILKPVEEQELYDAVKKTAEDCNASRMHQEEVLRLKENKEKNDKIVASIFLLDLLKGGSFEDPMKRQGGFSLLPQEGFFLVLALMAAENQRLSLPYQNFEKVEKFLAASLLFSESDHVQLIHAVDPVKGVLYLCICTSGELQGRITASCDILIQAFIEETGMKPVIGAGKPVDGLELMKQSCRQAEEALEYAVFIGGQSFVAFEELERNHWERSQKVSEFMTVGSYYNKQLLHALRSGDEERTNSLLRELFSVISENAVIGREIIVNYLYGLVNEIGIMIYNLYHNTGADTAGVQILSLGTLSEMKDYVYDYIERVLEQFRVQKSKKDESIVKKVEELIQARYASDINLRTISSEVYLSPNYLGCIFKKTTGESFNDYLCRVRMEKAKELLASPKSKVTSVANAVGISNTSYFCVLFKNAYGTAPGEYQESIIRGILNGK
jgi:two-component system, response regulator YesN